jgi:hypothetical protein
MESALGEPLRDPVVFGFRAMGLFGVHGCSCVASVFDRDRVPAVRVDHGRVAVSIVHPAVGGKWLRIDCGSIPRRPCNL